MTKQEKTAINMARFIR
ncbi:Rop family plasmid primer RNA-binding protein, partial [Escherichia coli]